MSVIRHIMFLIVLFSSCSYGGASVSAPPASVPDSVLASASIALFEYAQKWLPHEGVLRKEPNGFVYVDVDDRYIHDLIAYIKSEGFEEPPYFGPVLKAGAHISVTHKEEIPLLKFIEIEECEETIPFSLVRCQIVHPLSRPADAVYVLVVESEALNSIRFKYGLPPPKLDFHITIGEKHCESAVSVASHLD